MALCLRSGGKLRVVRAEQQHTAAAANMWKKYVEENPMFTKYGNGTMASMGPISIVKRKARADHRPPDGGWSLKSMPAAARTKKIVTSRKMRL